MFTKEADFEDALAYLLLSEKGWQDVFYNPTENELIKNWAEILFANNRDIDRLNNQRLTDGEMAQILEQVKAKRTPLLLNGFINGKSVAITRDNPDDTLHFGREVSLKIYDRMHIAKGESKYQIARQPKFPTQSIASDRRGDMMLLINGMPVFHIELKKSGIPVSQATGQIEKYARNGIFAGLFSLVQIFVAMSPEDCVYFANPGPEGKFNPDFYFRWADFNNIPITDWKSIASHLISIPMAHQLIGFYTVADTADGVLKVMRSYQYYAAHALSDCVTNARWREKNQRGGYVWHTTGSGKTMTSFKSAQLIANSKEADKVVFLIDRIELGTQSLEEYRSFAEEAEEVQATESSNILKTKLKSSNHTDTLIVTSIQKMSRIKDEDGGMTARDIELINKKRIVIIVDEAHRSVFGDMLWTIKTTFPNAIFFGFTGTPIHEETKKTATTADVFGDELHRYSIADGIRDKNVLGFDPYMVTTFDDRDVRTAVALHAAKAVGATQQEQLKDVFRNPKKQKIYEAYMQKGMAGSFNSKGEYVKGIEDYLTNNQYDETHMEMVVKDIDRCWLQLSKNGKFHALFATESRIEAITYYRMIKHAMPDLKVTALFDPNEDDNNPVSAKIIEEGLVEIISDYNNRYGQTFDVASHAKFKKDISSRLAHKDAYRAVEQTPEKQIDLLIVVKQMLTGFDSKWVNTLYMDKYMVYANIIQAFSRTNRLFGHEKPFGTIRYYRRPHTMEQNIYAAVKAYSGDKPLVLFAEKLPKNINKMNSLFEEISAVFRCAGVPDFIRLPDDKPSRGKFAELFKKLSDCSEAAKIQGFVWTQNEYELKFDEQTYQIILLRYSELFNDGDGGAGSDDAPYDLYGYLTEVKTGEINKDYVNSRFDKYIKALNLSAPEAVAEALNDLHMTFAALTQEEQKYANIFLHDIQRGDVLLEDGKPLYDYIVEYQVWAKNSRIAKVADILGLNSVHTKLLYELSQLGLNEANLDGFGRFKQLIDSVDISKAREYYSGIRGGSITEFETHIEVDKLLRASVLKDGFDI